MSFIPEDEMRPKMGFNFAPMIDFLFLMVAFFACLAVSRITTKDTDIQLVKIKEETNLQAMNQDYEYKMVTVNINERGDYNWITEIRDYPMSDASAISDELLKQYQKGILPEDKLKTQVLLKIDKDATWEPILKAIFAIRDAGFEVRPVYEPDQFSEKHLNLTDFNLNV